MQKEVRQIRKGEYKYPYRLELRLNETQMARLQSLASKSGLSMSAYVRQLIDGVLPQERPPLDFYKMLTELRYAVSLRYGANQTRPDDFGAWDVYP